MNGNVILIWAITVIVVDVVLMWAFKVEAVPLYIVNTSLFVLAWLLTRKKKLK